MIIPLTLITLISAPKAVDPLPFESISISPLYINKESVMVVSTKSSYLKFFLFIQNDKNMNVAVVSGEITKAGTYTYSYDNSYTRNKNTVFVRYSTDGQTYSDTPHVERNCGRASYEYITNNESIRSDNNLVVIKGNMTTTTRSLTYSFSGFEGLYVPTYFHKICLSDFRILITKADHPFFNCSASLVIKNYNNAFSGIDGAGENVVFPLNLVERNDGFTFALANDYRVSTESLKMYSDIDIMLMPKTRHVYLPRNEMQNQDKYQCYLQFNDFGIDKDLIIHQFEVRATKNIFGDCSNSKYCIIRE